MLEKPGSDAEERKFLHDIASPLAVIKTLTRRMEKELLGEVEESSKEKQAARLQKILQAVASLERLHADQKCILSQRDSA